MLTPASAVRDEITRRDWFRAGALSAIAFVTADQIRGADEEDSTALGKLAAIMKPGTWAELKTQGFDRELIKAGAAGNIFQYADSAAWDPVSKQIFFVGQGHYAPLKFIKYSARTNTWTLLPTPDWWKGPTDVQIGHAYGNNAIDQSRRILYYLDGRPLYKYDIAKEQWTTLPKFEGPSGFGTALAYFPEMKGLIRVYKTQVHFFGDEKPSWTLVQEKVPMGQYHNFAKYNAVQKVVMIGGGNGSKDVYKLDAQGTVIKLAEAPCAIGPSLAWSTVDPVSGNLLVLEWRGKAIRKKFHALDVMKNEWRSLPDAPVSLGFFAPLPIYGVNILLRPAEDGPQAVYLYKHALA